MSSFTNMSQITVSDYIIVSGERSPGLTSTNLKFVVLYAPASISNSRNRECLSFSFLRNFIIRSASKCFLKLQLVTRIERKSVLFN